MNQTKTYEYADGNSNLYLLTETELRYVAVVAEESSSGVYSGGANKNVLINSTQYTNLQTLFEKAIRNTDAHAKSRIMMSAIVSSISANEKRQCILKPGSPEINEIESSLKRILDK